MNDPNCSVCRWIQNGADAWCETHGKLPETPDGKVDEQALQDADAKRKEHNLYLPNTKHGLLTKGTAYCTIDDPCYSQDCDVCVEAVEGRTTFETELGGFLSTREGEFALWLASSSGSKEAPRSGTTQPQYSATQVTDSGASASSHNTKAA